MSGLSIIEEEEEEVQQTASLAGLAGALLILGLFVILHTCFCMCRTASAAKLIRSRIDDALQRAKALQPVRGNNNYFDTAGA